MESARNTNQWLGATARAFADYPAMALSTNPAMDWLRAWGEVTERTFSRMVVKPDWNIPPMVGENGKESPVVVETLVERPFGDLIHFSIPVRKPRKRRVLLVAPMSGHYATVTMGQLEQTMIQRVGFKYAGVGRMVYPGLLQLGSFISMNAETHANAFRDQIIRTAKGDAREHDKHNAFYDEYLAVMDMTAEFYLSTVERIFKGRDIARNDFVVAGHKVDIGKIDNVAVKIVEGENDDISAPGQCLAALDLLTGLDDSKKAAHLEPGAGHYGIFAGNSWRKNIRPLVLDFIDANSGDPPPAAATAPKPTKADAANVVTLTPAKAPAKAKTAPKAKPAAKAKAPAKAKPATKAKAPATRKASSRKTGTDET